nr:unnamed protein product [Spirometra erinaceieuropaei]
MSFRDNATNSLVRAAYLRKLYNKWSESQLRHPTTADGDIPYSKSPPIKSALWSRLPSDLQLVDLSTRVDEPLPMEDVVSSLAEEVLVEVSEDFKAHAIESYIDKHGRLNSHILPNASNLSTEIRVSASFVQQKGLSIYRGSSDTNLSNSLRNLLLGRYERQIPSTFVSACYLLQEWITDSTKISACRLNSALKSLQEDWFRTTLAEDATFETMEAYIEVLSHFVPYVLQRVVNFTDEAGNTLLHLAIKKKLWQLVVVLLSKCDSCHTDHFNDLGFTPLMTTAFCISQPMSVDEQTGLDLLIKKSDPNLLSKNRFGASALFLAASNRKTDMVSRLVSAPVHADANLTDSEGNSPLMIAVKRNNWEIVRILVTHADINLEQKNDWMISFMPFFCPRRNFGETMAAESREKILELSSTAITTEGVDLPDRSWIILDFHAELLETGWLSGAYNVPLDELFFGFLLPDDEFELKFGFKKPQPSQVVMLYCKTHRRSRKAQKLLEFLGFSRCLTIEGGIEDLLREIKKPGCGLSLSVLKEVKQTNSEV